MWLARSVLGQFRAVKLVYRSRFNDERPFQREFEGITRAQVYECLAYYEDHRGEIDVLVARQTSPENEQ